MRDSRFVHTIFGREPFRDVFINVYVCKDGIHHLGSRWDSKTDADKYRRGSSRFVYRLNIRARVQEARA